MEWSSIGNVAKYWEFLYFSMNFLTSFVRSLPHRSLIEIFSDRYIVTSASGKYFDNGLPQSTRYSVYLSSLSLISWAQKKCDGGFYVANQTQRVIFVCRPTRRMYGSIEVPKQIRSVTTNSFSLREIDTALSLFK